VHFALEASALVVAAEETAEAVIVHDDELR
jgi:hypothetical protein